MVITMTNEATGNPYVGPRTFTEAQSHLFFGREREARDLCARVLSEKFVLFYAQSGAGKSSLINTRLIPQLRKFDYAVLPVARVSGELPAGVTEVDNVYLFNLMLSLDSSGRDPGRFAHMQLTHFLARLSSEDGRRFVYEEVFEPVQQAEDQSDSAMRYVLIIDQFEELITSNPTHWRKREEFFRQLNQAMMDDPKLWVVISFREDFLAPIETYAALMADRMRARFYMGRMDYAAALEAVKEPAKMAGRPFAENVAERLVNNLCQIRVSGQTETEAGQYVAPVQLQVVCYQLWEKMKGQPGDEITAQDLEQAGNVDNALADFYELAVANVLKATGVSEIALRKWFERKLITEARTRGTVYQGVNDTGGLPNEVVKALERQFLLRAEIRAGGAWFELVHDRFVDPVRQANKAWFQQNETPLQHQAALWDKEGRPNSLLIKGKALESAEKLASVQHDELEDREKEFLAKCRMARLGRRLVYTVVFFMVALGAIAYAFFYAKEEERLKKEQTEHTLTFGQIEMFRKMAPSIASKWDYTNHARNVFGSVATHLWSKGDERSLDIFINILRASADLIPPDYGVERLPAYVMPFVDDEADWPLTVKYNPKREFNDQRLLFEWRSMAISMARTWGIPVPMRLKIKTDPNVSANQIIIIANTSFKDKEEKEPTKPTINVSIPQGQILLSTANLPERLNRFYEDHKKVWTPLRKSESTEHWYLAPNWTQPLWIVAGRTCYPIEQGAAFLVASKLLEYPELVLTPECVQTLLTRLRDSHPDTIDEALKARAGLKGIAEDLSEIVRKGIGLNRLEYLLDALAKYPKSSPYEAAELAIEDQSGLAEQLLDRLPGLQARDRVISAEQPPDRLPVSQGSRLEVPADEQLLKSHQQAYEEANPWLSPVERPIRVYLGDRIYTQFTTPEGDLKPKLMEALKGLRNDIENQFGITVPGVRFRVLEQDLQKKHGEDSLRIEILNQTSSDEDALPIRVVEDRALEEFVGELRRRCIAKRTWWLTAERTSQLRDDLPEHIRKWLGERYTLTDLKLILRAVILPDKTEQASYEHGLWKEAVSGIPPEKTLNHLSWLLGSLVFWTNVTDPLNTNKIAGYLRQTQHARLKPIQGKVTEDRVSELIKTGIQQYNKQQLQMAKESFDAAVRLNPATASRAFQSLYSQDSQITLVEKLQRMNWLCSLPLPGEIATSKKPEAKERIEVEEFLRDFGSQISAENRFSFQLWLLWSCSGDKGDKRAAELRERLIAEAKLSKRSAKESYLLAYLMLEAHGELMVRPNGFPEIRKLLLSAFKEFTEKEAERAYDELSSVINQRWVTAAPIWYISLLSTLADLHPRSFWIPYRLGAYLTSGRYSQKELESALVLLDRAIANLASIELNDQRRLRAWLDYNRSTAYQQLSYYQDAQNRRILLDQAYDLLRPLKAREQEKKGWPGLEFIYYDISLIHILSGKTDQAMVEVENGLERFPESLNLLTLKCFLLLAMDRLEEAWKMARDYTDKSEGKEPFYQIWSRTTAMIQMLLGEKDFNSVSRRYLNASYDDRDYIRMMLYWALCKQGREADAKELLAERWPEIKPSDWTERLEQGDKSVRGEMLLAYYAGKIGREEVFGPLEDRKVFEKSNLTKIGETFLGFQCDYFYDALLQEVSGNPDDRPKRAIKSLEKVVAVQQPTYFEYHMARYLVGKLRSPEK
jgi:hypothetical protein